VVWEEFRSDMMRSSPTSLGVHPTQHAGPSIMEASLNPFYKRHHLCSHVPLGTMQGRTW
jgi:hypothetical protein